MHSIPRITYDEIEEESALTHAHIKSRISYALYVEITKSMIENDLEINEHISGACEKIKKPMKAQTYWMSSGISLKTIIMLLREEVIL